MVSSASVSPVRQVLEERLSRLLRECEEVFEAQLSQRVAAEVAGQVAQRSVEAGERARAALADHLNQAARRIRRAPDVSQLAATLIDAAGAFASGVALLRVSKSAARGERIRGVAPEKAEAFRGMEISLASAAALAEAVRSRDPVAAIAESSQISPMLVSITGQHSDARAFLYPVVTGDQVPACLYAWGTVQGSALELLTQFAGAAWAALPSPADLVNIGKTEGAGHSAWESLSADEQRVHLRAQRVARVQVAEIRLFHTDAVQAGRAGRNLYAALRGPIDAARESFRKIFFEASPSMVDYLHLELLRALANNDPELFGDDYPGPII